MHVRGRWTARILSMMIIGPHYGTFVCAVGDGFSRHLEGDVDVGMMMSRTLLDGLDRAKESGEKGTPAGNYRPRGHSEQKNVKNPTTCKESDDL